MFPLPLGFAAYMSEASLKKSKQFFWIYKMLSDLFQNQTKKETEAADFRFSNLIFWEQKNRPSVISNWNFIADCLLSSNACP